MDTLVESEEYFEKDIDVEKGMTVQPYPSPSVSSDDLETIKTITVSFAMRFKSCRRPY